MSGDLWEEWEDKVRFFAEECDQLQVIYQEEAHNLALLFYLTDFFCTYIIFSLQQSNPNDGFEWQEKCIQCK